MKKYLLIFVAVILASCTYANNIVTSKNIFSLDLDRSILENSVVYIASSTSHLQHGTGMVTESRVIVTAKHVAEAILSDGSSIQIRTKSGAVITSQIAVAMSETVDVAILFLVEDAPVVPVPLTCRRAATGDEIFSVGHPLTEEWIYTFGYIARNEADPQFSHQATTMPVANGMSGAPVFNSLGQFVGLINSFLTITLPSQGMTPVGPIRIADHVKAGFSLIIPADIVCTVYNKAKRAKLEYENNK